MNDLLLGNAVDTLIREVATHTLMPYFRQLKSADIKDKGGPDGIFTSADEETEAALTHGLARLLPAADILGEEAVGRGEARIEDIPVADLIWVIDPIDGTKRFVAGAEDFTILVSLIAHGKTMAGWVYEPVRDILTKAVTGHGATCNGRKMQPPPHGRPLPTLTGKIPEWRRPANWALDRDRIEKKFDQGFQIDRGSGISYVQIANGTLDYVVSMGNKPWDVAAGALILNELGGASCMADGKPYQPGYGMEQTLLCLGDPAQFDALWQMLELNASAAAAET